MNGFFAPYAYMGIMYFLVLILISFFSGLLLKKIINKKWTVLIVVVASFFVLYLFDLGRSSFIIGIFTVATIYAYFFKIKIFDIKNNQKNEKK